MHPASTQPRTALSSSIGDECWVQGSTLRTTILGGMHENEIHTDSNLVQTLLRAQFPWWADLPVERVASAGTDNAMYRLGEKLAVRLPRIDWAVDMIAKEQACLSVLAPHLPLAVPVPVASGAPQVEYPYPWAVVPWLPGSVAVDVASSVECAEQLADFVRCLQIVDPASGPPSGRGVPVRSRDQSVRAAIAALDGEVDAGAVADAWNRVLQTPDYVGPGVWLHGDLSYLNLLTHKDQLSAVIDWGQCGTGDPAIDLLPAWTIFDAAARSVYRAALDVDEATWSRGKGWALTNVGVIPYYRETNPTLVANAIRGINAVLADLA